MRLSVRPSLRGVVGIVAVVASFSATVALAGCEPGDPPVAAPPADDGCAELTLIGARGSGQGVDSADPTGFGREAGALALAVAESAADEPFGWDAAFAAVDYPAIDVPTARADPATFEAGVRDGAYDAVEQAERAVEACPDTRLVLIGSSQGAVVVHGFAALVAADAALAGVRERVLGVVLLGDPTRRRADTDVELADLDGVAGSDGFLTTDQLDVGPALGGRVLSVCSAADTVCASAPGTTWANLQISPAHNTAYVGEEVEDGVLAWLGSRPDLGP